MYISCGMKTVLIIENDPDTLDVLETVIGELGVQTISKRDTIPLDQLGTIDPDLILLDHWLDGHYGADYCKTLKADKQFAHIPVIIISFVASLKSVSKDSGADDCISKPFDIEELQKMIRGYLEQVVS